MDGVPSNPFEGGWGQGPGEGAVVAEQNASAVHLFLSSILGDLNALQQEMIATANHHANQQALHRALLEDGIEEEDDDSRATSPSFSKTSSASSLNWLQPQNQFLRVPQWNDAPSADAQHGEVAAAAAPAPAPASTTEPSRAPHTEAGSAAAVAVSPALTPAATPAASPLLTNKSKSLAGSPAASGTATPTAGSGRSSPASLRQRFRLSNWDLAASVATLQDVFDLEPHEAEFGGGSGGGGGGGSGMAGSGQSVARRHSGLSLRRSSSLKLQPFTDRDEPGSPSSNTSSTSSTPTLAAHHTRDAAPQELVSARAERCEPAVLGTLFEWFCPDLGRNEVDRFLTNGVDGAFVVRRSTTSPDSYVICLKFGTLVLHFLLARHRGEGEFFGGCMLSGGTVVYRSLVSFVAHHTIFRGALPCKLVLPEPVKQAVPKAETLTEEHEVSHKPEGHQFQPEAEEDHDSHDDAEPDGFKEELRFDDTDETRNRTFSQPVEYVGEDGGRKESFAHQRVNSMLAGLKGLLPKLRMKRSKAMTSRRVSSLVNKIITSPRSPERRTIHNFIACTRESEVSDPGLVMQNIRQFLDGMRNYMFSQHGEKLDGMVAKFTDTDGMEADEVNLDGIIEAALVNAVVQPLSMFVYQCIGNNLKQTGERQKLVDGFQRLRGCTAEQLGVKPDLVLCSWEQPVVALRRIGKHASPLRKLQSLLAAVQMLHDAVAEHLKEQPSNAVLGADDFLPLFIYTLLQTGLEDAEIYAEYMWGLLDPSLLSGEGGYYLTTLSSALLVLKTYSPDAPSEPPELPERLPCMDDMQGFLRVYFADREHMPVNMPVFKTLALGPGVTADAACKMIARKFRIPNPSQYALFEVRMGQSALVQPDQLPQHIKSDWPLERSAMSYYFTYGLKTGKGLASRAPSFAGSMAT